MALLQIKEPGQSALPHQQKLAIGIDLGTTNSLVATMHNGYPEILLDSHNQTLIPSIVSYQKNQILVGHEAKKFAISDPQNTIISAKRLLGRNLQDIQTRYPNLPYQFSQTENNLPLLNTIQGVKSAVEISAEVLKFLHHMAQQQLSGEILGAVITVPAYFDDAQRQSTKDAARLAGLHVLRLLNEPTAAAVAYGLDSGQEGIIAVYDLGGGTFDISILRLGKGVFEVLATGGNTELGGDDIDHLLADWIVQQSLIAPQTQQQQRELLEIAIKTKIILSVNLETEIDYAHWQGKISRNQFNQLIEPLVKKSLQSCRRALKDAEVNVEQIANVVMVGGSTRIPFIRDQVGDFFQTKPLTHLDPDKVVALGAAIQANILVGNKSESEMLLLDVIPLSLGVETMGGLVEKIIPRNTTIPIARAQEFTTFKDGQTAMSIHVVQGERELVSTCRSLARFTLRGIPPMVAGAAQVRITYQVDADGLLNVTALEKSTGIQSSIEIKPSYGLTDTEVTSMLMASLENAKEDMVARELTEQIINAHRLLETVNSALQVDSELLIEKELTEINSAIANVEESIKQQDVNLIIHHTKQLNTATQVFAERRMEQSVKNMLTGQSVSDVEQKI